MTDEKPDIARLIMDKMAIMYAHVSEQGFEPFRELMESDPEEGIRRLPEFLERITSAGNGFFSGLMCGGPGREVTTPLINAIGAIYPKLSKPVRESALLRVLGVLDGLRYDCSQDAMELVHEPLLLRDILVNRKLYWCGFKFYTDKLKGIATLEDFSHAFMEETERGDSLNVPSIGWLSYALNRIDLGYNLPMLRYQFAEWFPEIVDRTKDFAAGLAFDHSRFEEVRGGIPFSNGVRSRIIKHYPEDWREDLERKIGEKDWIYLPETLRDLKLNPDYSPQNN